jgi:capsular polysaccharide export protein
MKRKLLFVSPKQNLWLHKTHSGRYFEALSAGFDRLEAHVSHMNPLSKKYTFKKPGLKQLLSGSSFDLLRRAKKFKASQNGIIWQVLQVYYCVVLWLYYAKYLAVLKDYECVVVWNGFASAHQGIILAARELGLRVIFMENGAIPNTLTVDTSGVNYFSSLPRTEIFYKAYHDKTPIKVELVQRENREGKVAENKAKTLPESFIFVPFQVAFDTQIVLPALSPFIRSMHDLYELIDKISKASQTHFVIKEHPSCPLKYTDLHEKAKNNPYITFANSHTVQDLIEKSEAVITVNSSVGLEGMMFYKKIIVLGNAFYGFPGNSSVRLAKNLQEAERCVFGLKDWVVDGEFVSKFVNYLHNEFFVDGDRKKIDEKHIKSVENKILMFLNS